MIMLITLLEKCFVEEVIVTSFICSSVVSPTSGLVCLSYRIFGACLGTVGLNIDTLSENMLE